MSISSQLPHLVTAARTGALQALALQAGQMLEGKVIGPAPNGGTQVQLGQQMLNLLLPMPVKAGDTLKFEVQVSGQQMRLALQPTSETPPRTAAPPPSQLTNSSPAPTVAAPLTQAHQAAQGSGQIVTSAPLTPLQVASSGQTPVPVTAPAQGAVPSAPTTQIPVAPAVAPAIARPASAAPPASSAPIIPSGATARPAIAATPAATIARVALPASPQPAAAVASQVASKQGSAPPVAASAPLSGSAQQAASAARPQIVPASTTDPTIRATQPPAPAAVTTPAQPTTPAAALSQMVPAAAQRQMPVSNLMAGLTAIAGKVALPEPVLKAIQQVMAQQMPIGAGKVDAARLQRAIQNSGVFQEAKLAQGAGPLLVQPDMKSSLLALRQTLTTWLGNLPQLAAVTPMPPPVRGAVPRARDLQIHPVDPSTGPEQVGKQLLERTEGALSRIRLHQHASLPDPSLRTGGDWSLDLPVLIGAQQTLLHIHIHRDQDNANDHETGERGWKLRFAVNLPELGEVGAQVSLRGRATGIMFWAVDEQAARALQSDTAVLREALEAAGLKPGAIIARHGEPPTPPPAASGLFVDARS